MELLAKIEDLRIAFDSVETGVNILLDHSSRRVAELLEANNAEVERRRAAEAREAELRKIVDLVAVQIGKGYRVSGVNFICYDFGEVSRLISDFVNRRASS